MTGTDKISGIHSFLFTDHHYNFSITFLLSRELSVKIELKGEIMKIRTAILISVFAVLMICAGAGAKCDYAGCGCECWKDKTCYIEHYCEEIMPPMDIVPIRFYAATNEDGTYTLNLWFRNISAKDWPLGCNMEIRKGLNLLSDPSQNAWFLSEDINRGGVYSVSLQLKEFVPGARMTFYVMKDGKFIDSYYIRL